VGQRRATLASAMLAAVIVAVLQYTHTNIHVYRKRSELVERDMKRALHTWKQKWKQTYVHTGECNSGCLSALVGV